MAVFYALVAFFLTEMTLAYMIFPGPCPKIELMADFDITKYMGVWYGYEELTVPNHNHTTKCYTDEYKFDNNGTGTVFSYEIFRRNGVKITANATWRVTNPAELTKTVIYYDGSNETAYERILATDYASYSIMYNCQENGNKDDHFIVADVKTRERKPPKAVDEKIDEIIGKYKLPKLGFRKDIQDECDLKPANA